MLRVLVLLAALGLAACEPQPEPLPPPQVKGQQLPPLPADIRRCLVQSGVDIPDRDLTVEDVERFWKEDRKRLAVMRRCGARLIAWYESVRKNWR